MVKTKREYILATCFLSGAAAIISFISLGTEEWVTSDAITPVVCLLDENICALLCGNNMMSNLRKLKNGKNPANEDVEDCVTITSDRTLFDRYNGYFTRNSADTTERQFINAGVWICTIIFLCLSAAMGLVSAGLAVWNTTANPYQIYFSVFGLYIYNGIAFFSILLTIILWGAMFCQDLLTSNLPTYKTFLESFTTKNLSQLGYSY
ncbi:uncharacterized protein BDFB_005225, partial [Asbolus verrucosus]